MNKYINETIKQAIKAYNKDEVPIGCIIVKNNTIISRGYNKTEKHKNIMNHSEIIAIRKAQIKLDNWRLNDCVLYTTLEPCLMCAGAIINSRIKEVYYFTNSNYISRREKESMCNIYLKNKVKIIKVNDNNISKNLLNDFFKEKRKNN